jgi:hypothetical protein
MPRSSTLGPAQPIAALLPAALYQRLHQAAKHRECSMGEITRAALAAYLSQPTDKDAKGAD